jgi:hypothetical protein
MRRIDGLEADECSFKYEIRSEPILGGVWFWHFFIGVPLIYGASVL